MSKKTDKILGRKPGRKQTLNLKRAAILGKPMPKTDEEERGEDGKWTSGGGGGAKRPKSEMAPDDEKKLAAAAGKLLSHAKPGGFESESRGSSYGTDPDSMVDSADKKDGFDESKHPRDKGKFAAGQGGPAAPAPSAPKAQPKALADLRARAGIHPANAGKAAKAAEEHAAALKQVASQTKDPEHVKVAAKAEMHAKAARESAQKAVKATTPVVAASHAADAKESAGKAEELREHLTREVGKKADKEEREGHAAKEGKGGAEGAEASEGGEGLKSGLRALWEILVGK